MKRLLVWLTLIAMLITAVPVASADNSYTYTKDDVMTAVSGMGRMPSNYYNLAGMGLEAMSSVSAAQAETFTKKLYQVWSFLSKYAYQYNGNKAINQVMTPAQWAAVTTYASNLAYEYGKPANHQALYLALLQFLGSAKTTTLVKPGVPRSLLGIQFDEATAGTPTTVKVYTTTDVTGGVYLADADGVKISSEPAPIPYVGTLATFNEYILTVNYAFAGKNSVRVCGVDAAYPDNYYSAKVAVASPADSGTNGTNAAATVTKVQSDAVALGTPSTIVVTASATTAYVKITDKKGVLLASSSTPVNPTATPRTFNLNYCFPSSGVQTIHVYAGTLNGASVLWNKNYKTANVSVATAAAKATISKVINTNPLRGQTAEIKVYASSDVTRVQLFDVTGDIAGFTKAYQVSGKTRIFTLHYLKTTEGSYKTSVQAGNDLDWNPAKKSVTVKFLAPAITKVTSTKVNRNVATTITVKASETITSVELYNSGMTLIATQTSRDASGNFVFSWTQPAPATKGTKTIYLKGYDSFGATKLFRSSVTFT